MIPVKDFNIINGNFAGDTLAVIVHFKRKVNVTHRFDENIKFGGRSIDIGDVFIETTVHGNLEISIGVYVSVIVKLLNENRSFGITVRSNRGGIENETMGLIESFKSLRVKVRDWCGEIFPE
jgi:hypothetical protein